MKGLHLSVGISMVLILSLTQCTPKTTEGATDGTGTEQPQSKPDMSDDPCAKFSDSRAGESALDAHIIYRDFIRGGQFQQAIPYWRQAFKAAPAADGQRQTHFEDGVDIYNYYLEKETTEAGKKKYLDSILYMFDRLGQCYGEPGYAEGRKGFDLYYKYRDLTTDEVIFQNFSTSLDKYGDKAPAFIINPFAALLFEMHEKDMLDDAQARKYTLKILQVTDQHEQDEKEGWPVVLSYAPVRLESFETVEGFYSCEYYLDKYYNDINLDSTDCEELFIISTRLSSGGCPENNDALAAIARVNNNRCAVTSPTAGPLRRAADALKERKYNDAIDAYQEYIDSQEDAERKAKYLLRISKIYYAHLKNFPKSRDFARKALQYQPNWGEPYMVIGKLYASSGPLCGPGRGFESQVVTWPAIDKFMQAKQVDPSVAAEANKLISTYQQYMPSVEDIFQRPDVTEGDSFTVGCWIQETTTVRAARG